MQPLLRSSLLVLVLTSCSANLDTVPARESVREQHGDTTVVRSGAIGTWGEGVRLRRVAEFGEADGSDTVTLGAIVAIATGPNGGVYATDRQRRAVRVFDDSLRPLAIWGREGSGPAELRNPDGGLAVLSDSRVAVRDPGNARMQLFGADGRSAGEWMVVDGGLRTRDNFGQQGDTLLSRVVVDASGPIDTWRYGLARIAADGRVLDTVSLPSSTVAAARLVARGGNNTAELPLPFAATSLWAWHPAGGFATADGNRYAITWPSATGLVRVEREVAPVAVSSAESAQERDYVTKGLQWLDPTWVWTGPEIPSTKPLISRLFVGLDGSVWALREGEAVEREDPDYDASDPSSVERRLRSRLIFDVFESSGEWLGSVDVPEGLRLQPQPVFEVTGLVGLELDRDGVPRLVRYGVEQAREDQLPQKG